MDFYRINERITKDSVEIYPDFTITRSKDLMVRGKSFYAIWDEERGLWSTDEYDVQRLIDAKLWKHKNEIESRVEGHLKVKLMGNFSSNLWLQFRNYVGHLSDSSHQLDANLTFSNTVVKKTDYVSKRLPYALMEGDISAYDEIMSTLYDPEERAKIEWVIGAIVAGDSKSIQKFLVLYGPPGSGKGTVINIILSLFAGYYTTFEAKSLTGSNNAFSTEVFKGNPLIAIQHDGDLSKIEDNSKLNSIISHEEMTMNEKFKPSYTAAILAFLIMGSNKPVKITDAKSGILRRLIDVQPSGRKVAARRYQALMSQIDFELGAIAHHCLELYRSMGKHYYDSYRPVEMMLQTDIFYNYIETYFDIFKEQNGATLSQAYDMYKRFCEETLIEYKLPQYKFREELRNYFAEFSERAVVNGERVRSWYSEFRTDKFKVQIEEETALTLVMEEIESIFDSECANLPAQYANAAGTPIKKWAEVTTRLSDLDTTQLHYVNVPEQHIVIDFDLKDEHGEKSAELNLEASSKWPATYSEFSKSGGGIHLHYYYTGDVAELNRIFGEGIEVKVFTGESSLRRRLSKCNNVPIASLSSGLPLREKKMINSDHVKSERALRDLVMRNLRKEIHPGTKPSIDFISKILEDAYKSNLPYDLTDMRGKILTFANNSSNQAPYCLQLMTKMKFKSAETAVELPTEDPNNTKNGEAFGLKNDDGRLVVFDVEVFPNLFVICWKYEGSDKIVRMTNPGSLAVEQLMKLRLVGFNNRRYDNHILYGRYMGYNNEQLYKLSKKIIDGVPGALFGEAYDLSYADIYDFSSKKQGLKKFEIELHLPHKELGLPWDEPVDESLWESVIDYCCNDVEATDAVLQDRKQDLVARQILADLSGLPVNATTNQHTAKIIFGNDKDKETKPKFKYTDLSEMFEGYKFELGKSMYRGEEVGEGGYVYAEPGMYFDVALLDVASMHPTSIEILDMFGPYTKNFSQLKAARLAIKHGDYDSAKKMLGGALAKYLTSKEDAEELSFALKIVINIVYGMTSARFDNPFKDMKNKDNIVAKRGALFMIDLKHAVQERGFTVAHIKTDSIKIPNATPEIIEFVMEFGEKYGYTFEHEATYEKMCLVNKAVYVAKTKPGRNPAKWSATGAQFAQPVVFKTLFSTEPTEFNDYCVPMFVTKGALFLDFNPEDKKGLSDKAMVFDDALLAQNDPKKLHFVGKAGLFVPVMEGGARLVRIDGDKVHAATGAKDYSWMEAEMVEKLDKRDIVDLTYFDTQVTKALDAITKFGDATQFCA